MAKIASAVVGCLMLMGCHPHDANANAQQIQKPDATKSPWSLSSDVDSMTDERRTFLTLEGQGGTMTVLCKGGNDVFVFDGPTFLAVDGQYGDALIRFDDQKADINRVAFHEKTAHLGSWQDSKAYIKAGGDTFMVGLNGFEFRTDLSVTAHKRMRVRLTAFNGETEEMEFDVSDAKKQMSQLETACSKK